MQLSALLIDLSADEVAFEGEMPSIRSDSGRIALDSKGKTALVPEGESDLLGRVPQTSGAIGLLVIEGHHAQIKVFQVATNIFIWNPALLKLGDDFGQVDGADDCLRQDRLDAFRSRFAEHRNK